MRKQHDQQIDLVAPLEVLHEHLTASLCEEAWGRARVRERQRKWSLQLLVSFWVAVSIDPPPSLRQALAEAAHSPMGRYRAPRASPQAFFARSLSLRWDFFRQVFEGFLARATAGLRPRFCAGLGRLKRRFPALVAIDGSGLDAVARRLRILWDDRAVPLPGVLLALYDIGRGVLIRLQFEPSIREAEFNRAVGAIQGVRRGSLLVGDRLYGVPKFFAALSALDLFGVARRFSPVRLAEKCRRARVRVPAGVIEDFDTLAGTPQGAPQRLRLIRLRKGKRVVLELFTNVLDRTRLSAQEAVDLYRSRWTVERLFYDLKEVLSLRRFYAANTNAVGMQVFSAAIVHTAMRVAQGEIAEQAGIEPEAISAPKLYPKVAAASCSLAAAQYTVIVMKELNPRRRLRTPEMRELPFARASLASVLVEPRRGRRRRRRRCVARTRCRSLPRTRRRHRD
jgi:hypothetical protein